MKATVQHLAKYCARGIAAPNCPCRSLARREGASNQHRTRIDLALDRQCAQPHSPCCNLTCCDAGTQPGRYVAASAKRST